jgi:hypothetical protein
MLTFTYQLFAIACGWLEAVLYARLGAEAFRGNEHAGMVAQRLAAWLLVPFAILGYRWLGWYVLLEVLPAGFLFPLFHDEAYNFSRLWIGYASTGIGDGPARRLAWQEYRYGYQSPTTTARNDFNGRERTWLAAVGCLLLVVGYWLLPK